MAEYANIIVDIFNEKLDKTVSYRLHGEKETTTVSLDEFIKLLNDEIANKR